MADVPAASLPWTLAGEPVRLYAERALYWPARRRLVIADLHLGKGDTFRRHGIAVPSGGTADDLARLAGLLARTGARELWVLGDMLHGDPAGARRSRHRQGEAHRDCLQRAHISLALPTTRGAPVTPA